MAAATISGKAIRQALAEQVGGFVFLGQATATGAANYITDTVRLQGVNLPAGLFDNCIVRIASGTRAGERVYVDTLDPINGNLYVTPNLTGATGSGDSYEVWLRGIDPDIADRIRDDCLARFCSIWRQVAVSLIPDGDLQAADVTHWTPSGGGAVPTKQFATFPDAAWRRELAVTHAAPTDYVSSDDVWVQPNERWFLQCGARGYVTADPGLPATAAIQVWDVEHSVAITLGGIKTSASGRGQSHISLLFTIPSNCYRIQFRLTSDTALSTTLWGPFHAHKRDKWRISLPDRITTKKRVGNFYEYTNINPTSSEIADFRFKFRRLSIEREQEGSQVQVNLMSGLTTTFAILYAERGYFDRLQTDYFTAAGRAAGDTAVTDCPKEYIVASMATQLSKWMLDMYGADWQDDWVRNASELAYWEEEFGPEPVYVEEVGSNLVVPQLVV